MTTSFDYRDIPIDNWQVTYAIDRTTGQIDLVTRIMNRVSTEILQSKNDCLRNALIDLGWFVPEHLCRHCGKQL